MGQPRIVAVDYGRVRVGLAISDPLTVFAQPLGAYSPADAISKLSRIADDEGIAKIVLGWPLELNGTEGDSVRAVRAFERRLRNTFKDIEIVRWDERYSSKEAARIISASGASRSKRRRKENVDAVAAAIILQSYLDK